MIGKTAKNVPVAEALDYVLGYTAANDVSSRDAQKAQTQWCYSKGFDGSLSSRTGSRKCPGSWSSEGSQDEGFA